MIRKRITTAIILVAFLITSVFSLSLNSQASAKVKSISARNVTTGELTLASGKKLQLDIQVYPKNAKNKEVKFKSSNSKVVSVNSKGVLTAKKAGTAEITVKSKASSKVTETIEVTVVTKSDFLGLKKIIPNFKEKEMVIDDEETITLTFLPTNASNTNVIYSSSDEDVVTVTEAGVITAVGEGEAVVSVKACDGSKVKAKIEIHVKNDVSDDSDSTDDNSNDLDGVE